MKTHSLRVLAALAAALAILAPLSVASPPACGLTPTGCETWTATYARPGEDVGGADDLVSPDGSLLFVVGGVGTHTHDMVVLVGYNATTGHRLWATTYAEPDGIPGISGLHVSPDSSRLYVVGTSSVGLGSVPRMFLLCLDARTGAILWSQQQALGSEGRAVTISPDGRIVYVVGAFNSNYGIFTYDASTGAKGWAAAYDWQGGNAGGVWGPSYDLAFDLVPSHDGGTLFLTGISTAPSGLFEYGTMALNAANGSLRWAQTHWGQGALGRPESSETYTIRLSPDETRVYVFGTAGVVAYDAVTGARLWISSEIGCRVYWPRIIDECLLWVSPDGTALYVFTHNVAAALDAKVGTIKWLDPLREGNDINGRARDAALSPDGSRLYITTAGGRDDQVTDSIHGVEDNYVTQALDTSSGLPRWSVTYGDGHQGVYAIDVSPDGGHVYVTGDTWPMSGTSGVATTVAYPTNLGLDNHSLLPF